MGWALIVILIVPLVAAAVALIDGWRAARAATVVSGVTTLALAVALAIVAGDGRTIQAAGGWLRLDALGAVFLCATGLLYAAGAIFSLGYLEAAVGEHGFAHYARRYF